MQPLSNRLEEQLLSYPYLHMVENLLQALNELGKSATPKSYMWFRSDSQPGNTAGNRIVPFNLDASRSGAVLKTLLASYQGSIMVVGYEAYEQAC